MIERALLGVSFSILLLLLAMIIFSENGIKDRLLLNDHENQIIYENNRLDAENQELARKISRLKKDKNYIEHIARHELDMAAEDEVVFRVLDPAIEEKRK